MAEVGGVWFVWLDQHGDYEVLATEGEAKHEVQMIGGRYFKVITSNMAATSMESWKGSIGKAVMKFLKKNPTYKGEIDLR